MEISADSKWLATARNWTVRKSNKRQRRGLVSSLIGEFRPGRRDRQSNTKRLLRKGTPAPHGGGELRAAKI